MTPPPEWGLIVLERRSGRLWLQGYRITGIELIVFLLYRLLNVRVTQLWLFDPLSQQQTFVITAVSRERALWMMLWNYTCADTLGILNSYSQFSESQNSQLIQGRHQLCAGLLQPRFPPLHSQAAKLHSHLRGIFTSFTPWTVQADRGLLGWSRGHTGIAAGVGGRYTSGWKTVRSASSCRASPACGLCGASSGG